MDDETRERLADDLERMAASLRDEPAVVKDIQDDQQATRRGVVQRFEFTAVWPERVMPHERGEGE